MADNERLTDEQQRRRTGTLDAAIGDVPTFARSRCEQNRAIVQSNGKIAGVVRRKAGDLAAETRDGLGFRRLLRRIESENLGAAREQHPAAIEGKIIRSLDFQ